MAAPTNCVNQLSTLTVNAATNGAFGYLGAHLFTSIPAINGGIFGGVYFVASTIVGLVTDKIFNRPGANEHAQCLGNVFRFVGGVALAVAVCGAVGVPLTFNTAVVLIITQFAAVILSAIVLTCLGCGAAGVGIAVGAPHLPGF